MLENPKKDEQHAHILDPGELEHFPEARLIGREPVKEITLELIKHAQTSERLTQQSFPVVCFQMHTVVFRHQGFIVDHMVDVSHQA